MEVKQLSSARFNRLAGFITRELGIKMPESKIALVENRLLRRAHDLGLDTVDEYAEHFLNLASDSEERIHFIDAVTTNKTDFFREPQHLDYLTKSVLPPLSRSEGGRNHVIQVWSAGCSSGQEPYSLAMLLSEHQRLFPKSDFAILATDVSSRVLESARAGIYDEALIAPVPREFRGRYLLRGRKNSASSVRITPQLRQKISFHRLNFMAEDYHVRDLFQIVFFRNVMIYFDRPTQEAVIQKLCRNLIPGGYLFIGHSESLSGLNVPLNQIGISIFQKRGNAS
jgi:chemotaxis protein methyltransferase CheR